MRKRVTWIAGTLTGLLLVAAAGYYMLKPQVVHAVFVPYSDMELLEPGIYLDPTMSDADRRQFQADLTQARARVEHLFGGRQASPTVIVCATNEAQARFGKGSGLTYYTPVGNYIVLGPAGTNVDVLAHELTHAELRSRLKSEVPVWFDEGLAATQDGRLAGMEAEWLALTDQGQAAPTLSSLETHDQFNAVTRKGMLLSYGTARREVEGWLQTVGDEGFQELLGALGHGRPFVATYQAIYAKHK